MGKKIILIALLIGCCFPRILLGVSNTAAAFSRYTIDGRIAGMGMAGTAIATNANAVLWNPAFLTQLQGVDTVLMSARAFETDYLSTFLGVKGWGVGYAHAGLDGIVETQRRHDDFARLTGNVYGFSGNVVYLSGAMVLTKDLSLGVTAKYLDERIATTNASGIGMDLGLAYTPSSWCTIGLMAENLLPPTLSWSTGTKETVPTIYKLGMAFDVIAHTLTAVSDVVCESNRGIVLNVGLDYTPIPLASFRAGLHNGHVTVGTGLALDGFRADIAWEIAPQTELDDLYRFSIGVMF